MRPRLLERIDGYVADIAAPTLYMVAGDEQVEIPLASLCRSDREHVRLGRYCSLLIYENRVSFRTRRLPKLTALDLKQARNEARRLGARLRKTAQ